jgi:hypothetical protein
MFEREGKTFVDVMFGETPGGEPERIKRIRISDVAEYFAHEAATSSRAAGPWRGSPGIGGRLITWPRRS